MVVRKEMGGSSNSLCSMGSTSGLGTGANSSGSDNDTLCMDLDNVSIDEGTSSSPVSSVQGTTCTSCKSGETKAVAQCMDCSSSLCSNCVMAHQFMLCFEGHRVVNMVNRLDIETGLIDDKIIMTFFTVLLLLL